MLLTRSSGLAVLLLALVACGDPPLSGSADVPLPDTGIPPDVATGDLGDTESAPDAAPIPDTSSDTGSEPDLPTLPDMPEPPADALGSDAAADAFLSDVQDAGEPPCTPQPLVPTGPTTDWKHWDTEWVVTLMGDDNHRGQDVLAVVGGEQLLIGKFAYGLADDDLEDEDVEVFIQDDPPCGPWISLGVVATSEDGQYGTQYGIEDDGGRVFFTIPEAQRRPVGRHPVRMLVHGDHSQAAFTLFVLEPGTQTLITDIDGTLTTDDFQLVADLFSDIFWGTYQPEMHDGSLEVMQSWADKGYLIVYLTGRPDWLRRMTLESVVAHGFPPGAVHLTDTNGQAMPTSGGVATYKTDFLNLIRTAAQVDIVAAYGNAGTDIEAYEAAGIDKTMTFIIDNPEPAGTVPVSSYPEHLPTAQAMPPAAVPAPPAFGWW